MDMNEDCDIIKYYLLFIESVEQLGLFFGATNAKSYVTVQQELVDCCGKIDILITLETKHSSFLALYQQKHQLTLLLDISEQIIKKELNVGNFNNQLKRLPEYENVYNNIQHSFQQKQIKKAVKNCESYNVTECTRDVPKVRGLSEIVGLHDIKKVLKSLVILPQTQPQLFYNRRICNSILLYGPPGTGKTRLTHALAAEAKAAFYCISAGDVLSHYVGQTEKTIKTLFQDLKTSCEFSILFIDEVDAFCRKRTENEQEHTRRIKTEFMCQMSGIEDYTNIIVICATNCPWDLDTAILRRLQKRIYVPLPNYSERLEFFQFLTDNIHFEDALNDWTPLVQKTDGYSGSDLFDVIQAAMTVPLGELEDTKIWKCCDDGFYEPVLGEQDFSNVICSELGDLPANSVRARKVQLNDLFNAATMVKCTVTVSEVKKFELFNGV